MRVHRIIITVFAAALFIGICTGMCAPRASAEELCVIHKHHAGTPQSTDSKTTCAEVQDSHQIMEVLALMRNPDVVKITVRKPVKIFGFTIFHKSKKLAWQGPADAGIQEMELPGNHGGTS